MAGGGEMMPTASEITVTGRGTRTCLALPYATPTIADVWGPVLGVDSTPTSTSIRYMYLYLPYLTLATVVKIPNLLTSRASQYYLWSKIKQSICDTTDEIDEVTIVMGIWHTPWNRRLNIIAPCCIDTSSDLHVRPVIPLHALVSQLCQLS